MNVTIDRLGSLKKAHQVFRVAAWVTNTAGSEGLPTQS